jgi:orotidine-5'-phosphate decarboxylase
MNREELFENIKRKKSFLCVGLDTDINKIPEFLFDKLEGDFDPIFEFNKAIIDATADLCVAYKPNTAFYESIGVAGWEALEKTVDYIREKYPDQFIIADAKRGDIGNTSSMYAQAFFENMGVDAVTVAPYMGEDSVSPFLNYDNKWVILLALTSNKGAFDFQFTESKEAEEKLFEKVLKTSQKWANEDSMMYVVGATKA